MRDFFRGLLRLVIQVVRVLFLPFPFAVFLGMSGLELMDHIVYPERVNSGVHEPGEVIGGVVIVFFAFLLQVVIGWPSLRILAVKRGETRGYLGTGGGVALVLSVLFTSGMVRPQFGETFGWLFPFVLLFLGVPIFLGYALNLLLGRACRQLA
jgi:hypothetical protein